MPRTHVPIWKQSAAVAEPDCLGWALCPKVSTLRQSSLPLTPDPLHTFLYINWLVQALEFVIPSTQSLGIILIWKIKYCLLSMKYNYSPGWFKNTNQLLFMKINFTIISRTNLKPVYYSFLGLYPLLLFIVAELSSSFSLPYCGSERKSE